MLTAEKLAFSKQAWSTPAMIGKKPFSRVVRAVHAAVDEARVAHETQDAVVLDELLREAGDLSGIDVLLLDRCSRSGGR